MIDRVAIRDHLRADFKVLLKDISVGWLDSLVIILFEINNFESELLIKLDGAIVVHLDVPTNMKIVMRQIQEYACCVNSQEYVVEVTVSLNVL